MRFRDWQSKFAGKYRSYLEQLSQIGESVAQYTFNLADRNEQSGEVTVSTEMEDAGFRIIASGPSAPFIEFGAGVETAVIRPTVQAEYDISPGSWSREHEGMFSKKNYWYYRGVRYTGLTPLMPMQYACQEMEHMSNDIARRVFR
jgi:hypothetical protein